MKRIETEYNGFCNITVLYARQLGLLNKNQRLTAFHAVS